MRTDKEIIVKSLCGANNDKNIFLEEFQTS